MAQKYSWDTFNALPIRLPSHPDKVVYFRRHSPLPHPVPQPANFDGPAYDRASQIELCFLDLATQLLELNADDADHRRVVEQIMRVDIPNVTGNGFHRLVGGADRKVDSAKGSLNDLRSRARKICKQLDPEHHHERVPIPSILHREQQLRVRNFLALLRLHFPLPSLPANAATLPEMVQRATVTPSVASVHQDPAIALFY